MYLALDQNYRSLTATRSQRLNAFGASKGGRSTNSGLLARPLLQPTRGLSTEAFLPYFLSRSLKASMANAFRVVFSSSASIRRALQPPRLMRVRTCLKASGLLRAVGPVVFGFRPI